MIIESRGIEFFEHLLVSNNKAQSFSNELSSSETSQKVISSQIMDKGLSELRRSTTVQKLKSL